MGVGERLRRLDLRVLGRPRPATPRTHLLLLLVGLVGTVAVLVTSLVRDDLSLLSGSGGFVGVAIAGAARWYRSLPLTSPWRTRPLVLLGAAASWLGLVGWAFAAELRQEQGPGVPTPRECIELRAEVIHGLAHAQELAALSSCPVP